MVCLLGSFLLPGCSDSPKNLSEYAAWFKQEENGFVKARYINNLSFKVQYKPVDLMMVSEIKNSKERSTLNLDSLRATYGESKYFILQIGPDQREERKSGDLIRNISADYAAYSDKVKYLSFYLKDQVTLICGKDTIPPDLYHYERSFELSPVQTFLFAFQSEEALKGKDMTFVYQDELFNAGKLNFSFHIDESEMPEIKI